MGLTYSVRPKLPAARQRVMKTELIRMVIVSLEEVFWNFPAMLCNDNPEKRQKGNRTEQRYCVSKKKRETRVRKPHFHFHVRVTCRTCETEKGKWGRERLRGSGLSDMESINNPN